MQIQRKNQILSAKTDTKYFDLVELGWGLDAFNPKSNNRPI